MDSGFNGHGAVEDVHVVRNRSEDLCGVGTEFPDLMPGHGTVVDRQAEPLVLHPGPGIRRQSVPQAEEEGLDEAAPLFCLRMTEAHATQVEFQSVGAAVVKAREADQVLEVVDHPAADEADRETRSARQPFQQPARPGGELGQPRVPHEGAKVPS
jgi:hypothetical protein